MNKSVCIITSVHPAFDPRIFHKQARTLAQAGYRVSLFAQHTKDETVDGIQVIALPRPHNRFQRVMATLDIFRRARAMKADVYHFHDPELLPIGLLIKKTTRAKVVYDVHEDYSASLRQAYYLPGILRPGLAQAVSIIEQYVSPLLDGVISATDEIGEKFHRHPHPIVIHNYPIVASFNQGDTENRKGPFRVVYAGVMTPERGLAEVIKAMACTGPDSGIRLHLYGKFVPKEFEDELRKLPGAEMVDFKGHLPPEQAWRVLAEGHAGVVCFHPGGNHERAMPNKLFEYMTSSLPVVASAFSLWKKIIEGNGCGIAVNPLDPGEIASAFLWLKNHPEEAREMGRRGRKAVMDKYSWENEAGRLLEYYRNALIVNPVEAGTA